MKLNQGKLIILLIFGISIAGAAFAIWFQNQTMGHAREFWGSANAFALRNAPQVDAIKFSAADLQEHAAKGTEGQGIDISASDKPAGDRQLIEPWKFGDDSLPVLKRKDISRARGLIHFRSALMLDDNFRFEVPRTSPVRWDYAVTFTENDRSITLLFDLTGQRARLVATEDGSRAASDPAFARDLDISPFSAGLRKFLDEQFAERKVP